MKSEIKKDKKSRQRRNTTTTFQADDMSQIALEEWEKEGRGAVTRRINEAIHNLTPDAVIEFHERELARLKALARTRPRHAQPSSTSVSALGRMAIETAERGVDRDSQESTATSRSGGHSGGTASPSPATSGASKGKRP